MLLTATDLLVFYFVLFFYHSAVKTDNKLQEIQKTATTLNLCYNKKSFSDTLQNVLTYVCESTENEYAKSLLHKQALVGALQSQINPHFLYNTLDSIRGKALEDGSRETADMIAILSSFFRYTISQQNPIVSIEQEMENTENYIRILQYRFIDRFTMEKDIQDISDNILQYSIPKLILQPLVENAVLHGLSDIQQGGKIKIKLFSTQSRIIISVSDNGKGINALPLKELNHSLTYSCTIFLTTLGIPPVLHYQMLIPVSN